jgi:hypothetical protein
MPTNLPSGSNADPDFVVTSGFLAQAGNPSPTKGVGPGEEVTIIYELQGAQTFQDVLDELADGTLRIGMHVTAFSNGASESFVNNAIPEPTTLTLLLFGTAGVLIGARRRAI